MELQPFSWGANGQKATPSSVKKYADIAAALAARGGTPQNLGEGLNRVGEALLANSYSSRAAAGEEEGTAARKAVMDALLGNADPTMADIGGALGNEWVTSDPGSSAIVQALLGQEMQQNDPLRQQQLAMGEIELNNARNPKPEFSMIGADELAQLGLPEGAYQRGADGKIYEIGGGGTNVTVNNAGVGPKLGSLSTDYGYVLGPDGQAIIDPATGLPTAAAVPGSPAAREAAALAAKADLAGDMAVTSNDIVATDIDRALSIIDTPGLLPTTGFGADWFSSVGGTAGNDLRNLLNTVKANTAFGTLQEMRNSSPTGGALGAVTAPELTLLEAAKGAVEQSQSPQQLKDNLIRLQNISLDIVHGKGNGPERKVPSFEQQSKPPTITQQDYEALPSGSPFIAADDPSQTIRIKP